MIAHTFRIHRQDAFKGLGDQHSLGRLTAARGFVAIATGDPVTGCRLMEDALVRLRETDDVFFEVVALGVLGFGNFVLKPFEKGLPAWRWDGVSRCPTDHRRMPR